MRRDSRSADLQVGRLLAVIRALHLRAAQQNRDGHAARRSYSSSCGGSADGSNGGATCCRSFPGLRRGDRRRVHDLVRARHHRRERCGLHAHARRKAAARRRVIWFYLGKLMWPAGLIFMYPRWTIDASAGGSICFPSRLWRWPWPSAFSRGASRLRHRPQCGGQARASCGISVLRRHAGPRAGFVNVYPFLFSYVADHFQYLASLGVIVPVASVLACQPRDWPRAAARPRDGSS